MRALVYRGANDLRLERVPVPEIGPRELLVKVAACGICPTDLKKIHYATVPPPRIFGHETSGTIVRVGSRIRKFKPGDRVALHHHVPCLSCHACRHKAFAQCATYKRTGITAGFQPAGGGFAEYVRVMEVVLAGVVKIPAGNDLIEGAMLEPVNTVLKGIRQLPLIKGDTVLVAGQGPIGLMFTRLLALQKMRVLATDFIPERLKMARQLGAVWTGKPDDVALRAATGRLTAHGGLDAAVIAVPSDEAVQQAQALLRGGGQVLLFAHTKRGARTELDLSSVCVDEKALIGSYSADFTLQAEVARLVFSRRLDVRRWVTHEFPLERGAEGVALASHPTAQSLKIVIRPDL